MDKYISKQKIVDFITAGLNNTNKDENFGYDGVTILTEIEYMDDEDVKPVTYSYWIHSIIEDDDWGGKFHTFKCSKCAWKTQTNPSGCFTYCPGCGSLIFDSEEIMNNMKGKQNV